MLVSYRRGRSRNGTTGGRDKDGSVSANRSGVHFYMCLCGCMCEYTLDPFFNLTVYGKPLCPTDISPCSFTKKICNPLIRQWVWSTKIEMNSLRQFWQIIFISVETFFLLFTLLCWSLRYTGWKLVEIWFGKQEREMGTSLCDVVEPETGRDSCLVHLEYSCSGFSLDVVCELLKVISVWSIRPEAGWPS